MKDKVLKLCRRLKSCTLSDLSAFIEIDEKIIETILLYLEQEGLIQNQNGLFTIENHSVIGGLGSAISELITDKGLGLKLVRIGVNDEFGQSGTASELLEHDGLSAIKITEKIKHELSHKNQY